jgi:DNA-binding CsgD family transcriptional regulator
MRAEADQVERAQIRRDTADAADACRAGESLLVRAHDAAARPSATFPEAAANALTCEAEYARLCRRADHRCWATAAAAWERLGFPAAAGYARFREAEAALADKAARPAAAALLAARRHVATLSDEPVLLLREIELLARRRRIDLSAATQPDGPAPAPTAADEFRLTPRERDVLPLLVEGYTNRKIARELFIAEKTASVHVSNIMAKLGVDNRGEAAAAAHRLGLVATLEPDAATASVRLRELSEPVDRRHEEILTAGGDDEALTGLQRDRRSGADL